MIGVVVSPIALTGCGVKTAFRAPDDTAAAAAAAAFRAPGDPGDTAAAPARARFVAGAAAVSTPATRFCWGHSFRGTTRTRCDSSTSAKQIASPTASSAAGPPAQSSSPSTAPLVAKPRWT